MRFAVLHHLESELSVPAAQVYAEVAEQVRVADELGYEIAWVAEHHFSASKGRAPEPLLLLTRLAAKTRAIRIGTAVLPAPFYDPIRLAESVAMADVLSEGRLACGISSSGVPDEMRIFGISQDGKHEQLRRTLLWLRRAWSGEAVEPSDGAGTPTDTERRLPQSLALPPILGEGDGLITIVPQPLQPIEDMVWVAASTPGAAGVAGELGHHLLLPSLRPPEVSVANLERYRQALAGAGVPLATRHVQCTLHLVIDKDHAMAMRRADQTARFYYERYVASGAVQRLEDESLEAIMERINFVAGGPEAIAEQVDRIAGRLGLTHVAFQARLIGLSQQEVLHNLELVMTEVAPRLATVAPA